MMQHLWYLIFICVIFWTVTTIELFKERKAHNEEMEYLFPDP